MAQEAAMSRLWGGIRFRSDNDKGLRLGAAVGSEVLAAWASRCGRAAQDDGAGLAPQRTALGLNRCQPGDVHHRRLRWLGGQKTGLCPTWAR